MSSIETLADIAEELADKFGIYGCYQPDDLDGGPDEGHPENCPCRICYVIGMTARMASAAEVDRKLSEVDSFGFGCHGCGAIGESDHGELTPGWKTIRRRGTMYFLCPKCQG